MIVNSDVALSRTISKTQLSPTFERLQPTLAVRKAAQADLQLSLRLMNLQDDERRRIARDLHDTVGQTLAAVKMSIALIRQIQGAPPALEPLIDDLNALADEALREVRTTSYLLHPPLLDEAGIAPAARWFAEGFSKRSGIYLDCDIPEKMKRPSRNCELVLFRILQESLTNVYRHSQAAAATIRLTRNGNQIELEIRDNGKGIPREHLPPFDKLVDNSGVGITGMRERVLQLGGQLEIQLLDPGTAIRASIPIHSAISLKAAEL